MSTTSTTTSSISQCWQHSAQRLIEVQIQADGGRAAWRAETIQIVCDFSAADGFRRDAHVVIRCEAQRQTRPVRRLRPLGPPKNPGESGTGAVQGPPDLI